MTDFAREVVKPALEQIDGVSQAEVIGGTEREILVRPDFDKLRLYGLTIEQISAPRCRSPTSASPAGASARDRCTCRCASSASSRASTRSATPRSPAAARGPHDRRRREGRRHDSRSPKA